MNHILRTNVPIGAAVALLLATWAMEAELASAETYGFVSGCGALSSTRCSSLIVQCA